MPLGAIESGYFYDEAISYPNNKDVTFFLYFFHFGYY